MAQILIIDDDKHINALLREALSNAGYRTRRALSGAEAISLLKDYKPDIILLDLMMPGLSGEELLPFIKDIPVIVVSAKAATEDKVGLLMSGAADYVTKPFDINELLARIAVQLRNKKEGSEDTLTYKDLTLDTGTHIISSKENRRRLTRTEYAILKLLITSSGQVVPKLTILDRISDETPDCTEDSLKIHIHNLRKKLKEVCGEDCITSVWGIGFMLKS